MIMDYAIAKRIILLTVLAAVSQLVECDCELDDLMRQPCEAELSCSYDFQLGLALVSEWSCPHTDYNDYDHPYGLDNTYIIHLKAENIDEANTFDPYSLLDQLTDHIYTISITNGKMNYIPMGILHLNMATTIDLSQNTIELLHLEPFCTLASLNVLNVSSNQIADLQVYETTVTAISQVHTIDLSHNAIKAIPNNYFRHFPNLLHLNLSHNFIKSLDILTFEGITQLRTLYISDNELTKLDVSLARFAFLKELFVDNNYLTIIEKSNFNSMATLEILNLSCNNIVSFENTTFDRLTALRTLDLNNNKIDSITKTLFVHNSNLQTLDMSLNMITKIEPGSFEAKRILNFKINSNPITGYLPKNTFEGIFTEKLDLSGANITELGPDIFEGQYTFLNFSKNAISKIHRSTFINLEFLTDLDLSYNQLQSIEFDMSKLKNLSYFYINNNNISKITNDMFTYLVTLHILDLSCNVIQEIDMHSFEHLSKLKLLKLNNNPLLNIIAPATFSGLVSTAVLDISYSNIHTLQSNAFNDMKSLKTFNCSYSNLMVLEKNAFRGTGSIQILDLSHNQLETFSINNTHIKLVEEIYLQHNILQYVTNETFQGLSDLRFLTLEGNNLIRIENEVFRNLRSLLKIDLSANQDVVFNSSIFSDMQSLSVVLLNNITSKFNLGSIVNTLVAGLDLSFCNISHIDSVLVHPIITLERLKMSYNEIEGIEKSSFQKLWQLSWVDLSYNKISNIQPGSFSDNRDLSILDLSNNLLSTLMFGVFEGLVNLNNVDLSNNKLHSFSASIFHNSHRIRAVYLDNNLIENIDFEEFDKENIREIYLGGNRIPCNSLTELKKIPHLFEVKAKNGIFDTENVDGVTCKSMTKSAEMNGIHGNKINSTAKSIGSLEELQDTVGKILNRSESYSAGKFLEVLNKTEMKNNIFLEKLMNSNNQVTRGIYRILENIQEYFKVHNSVSADTFITESNGSVVNANVIDTIQSKKRVAYMKDEFEVKTAPVDNSTIKYPVYFIAICLLCMLILILVLVYMLQNKSNLAYSTNLSHSRQPISNMMEME